VLVSGPCIVSRRVSCFERNPAAVADALLRGGLIGLIVLSIH
jgi:hypothetical protein